MMTKDNIIFDRKVVFINKTLAFVSSIIINMHLSAIIDDKVIIKVTDNVIDSHRRCYDRLLPI